MSNGLDDYRSEPPEEEDLPEMSSRAKLLQDATYACTTRAFERDGRSSPERNFRVIADIWSAMGFSFRGGSVTPQAVGLAQAGLKLARACDNPVDRDSHVDGAGYFACAWEVVER